MAITINNFKITNKGQQVLIDIETDIDNTLSYLLLWKMNDYKDATKTIDLSSYLSKTSNREVLVINASDVGVSIFEDMAFLEVASTIPQQDDCGNLLLPTLGVTYDLAKYYRCMIKELLELPLDNTICQNNKVNDMVITIGLLIDTTVKSIQLGYYSEAKMTIKRLQSLCSLNECKTCNQLEGLTEEECTSCNSFTQSTI